MRMIFELEEFLLVFFLCSLFLPIVPSVEVEIRSNETTPTAGEDYQLICAVSGIENLNATISYQWTKNSNGLTQDNANTNTLSFTPIRLSNAANYVCMVTITSGYLNDNIVTMDSQEIRVQCE